MTSHYDANSDIPIIFILFVILFFKSFVKSWTSKAANTQFTALILDSSPNPPATK